MPDAEPIKRTTYTVYPQFKRDGTRFSNDELKRLCWKRVCLNGPLPHEIGGKVSAITDIIVGELTILRCWFSSTGFMLIGTTDIGENERVYQEWWCVPG